MSSMPINTYLDRRAETITDGCTGEERKRDEKEKRRLVIANEKATGGEWGIFFFFFGPTSFLHQLVNGLRRSHILIFLRHPGDIRGSSTYYHCGLLHPPSFFPLAASPS